MKLHSYSALTGRKERIDWRERRKERETADVGGEKIIDVCRAGTEVCCLQ